MSAVEEVKVVVYLPHGVFEGLCDLATDLETPVTNMIRQILITAPNQPVPKIPRATGPGCPTPPSMIADIARMNREGFNDAEIADALQTTSVNVGRHRRAMKLPAHYTRKNRFKNKREAN